MVRRLLLVAVLVSAAAAVGEYLKVLEGAGCGDPVQTYNATTAAFCPTSQYPSCDIMKMIIEPTKLSCPGKRNRLVYRNNSVVWLSTTSIECVKNADGTSTLKNSEGETLYNVLRPTCASKAACDACAAAFQPTCPSGMTCLAKNLLNQPTLIAEDGCSKLQCADGALKLYNSTGAALNYNARELFCTVVGKWTNYSIDGSIVGGTLINETITANCVIPKACEECVAPLSTTDVSRLPTPFRTGYTAGDIIHSKETGVCSLLKCATGYTLYGFSGASNSVTGLEYTSKGFLKCSGTSLWTNGGVENTPSTFLVACLKTIPRCQACTQDMTVVTTTSAQAIPMISDITKISSGDCLQRTFTCKGSIESFSSSSSSMGKTTPDASTGISTLTLTCHKDGYFWGNPFYTVKRVECLAPPCKPYDPITLGGGAYVSCNDDEIIVECPENSNLEVLTTKQIIFYQMTFFAGKGWLAFDCMGHAALLKNADIVSMVCRA